MEGRTPALSDPSSEPLAVKRKAKSVMAAAVSELELRIAPPSEGMQVPAQGLRPIGLTVAAGEQAVAELAIFPGGEAECFIESPEILEDRSSIGRVVAKEEVWVPIADPQVLVEKVDEVLMSPGGV
jgi:hypothetical protein